MTTLSAIRAALVLVLTALGACHASGEAKSSADADNEDDDEHLAVEPAERQAARNDTKSDDRTELMKREHRKCFKTAKENHKGFDLDEYDITVTIRPNGTVSKVEVDESKTRVSHRDFERCLVGKLKQLQFPPPRRELKAHLLYPD